MTKPSYAPLPSRLEDALSSRSETAAPRSRSGIGVLVADPANRRLLESASAQLELEPVILAADALDSKYILSFELIVADLPMAAVLHAMVERQAGRAGDLHPAIIAVLPETQEPAREDLRGQPFDAVLSLPQPPASLAAQLSLLLYAHRSFAWRYHDAIEELQLNRRIFRSVTSGISVADARRPDLPLTYVNPAFEVMTGYTLEEVQGRNCRFLQGSERGQPAVELLREAIRDGREVTVVLKNFRKDGSEFWNELSLSPIQNLEGEVTHFVGIQTDVTARVEFEAALRESEKLAAVGRLASSIAHEINNPLESVMNLVYLAERTDNLAQVRQYLATADSELQRVKLITTQSLRFFKQSTRPQAVSCSELLDSVLALYHSRFINSAVEVYRRDRCTDMFVVMESEIRQVLNNLVSNAIDAMFRTGGRLLIRTRNGCDWRSGRRGAFITVADTGTGIDA